MCNKRICIMQYKEMCYVRRCAIRNTRNGALNNWIMTRSRLIFIQWLNHDDHNWPWFKDLLRQSLPKSNKIYGVKVEPNLMSKKIMMPRSRHYLNRDRHTPANTSFWNIFIKKLIAGCTTQIRADNITFSGGQCVHPEKQ